MTAHELARDLLDCLDLPISASIDLSTREEDSERRIFTDDCFGINNSNGDSMEIVLLFHAHPEDNYGKKV